ncbi:MAG: N-acetylmuramoyl-L-alanine amidase-like domain-containing protein [Xenococcus sp. (in: cyanobacteria)]
MRRFSLLLLCLGFFATFCSPTKGNPLSSLIPSREISQRVETIPDTRNRQRFQQIMQHAITQNLSQKPLEEIIQEIAQQFLGSSYQAGLLDRGSQETLIVSLTQFDCVLFVETVLALVRGIAVEDYTYKTFTDHIINQRYRDGKMNNYCDRLHYFAEWIADNQKRGNLVNLTSTLGGIDLQKTLNFMTTHRASYPQMITNEVNYQCIAEVEQNLRQLNLTYLPTHSLQSIYPQLRSGDIVGITTRIAGLDVTHTGLIYRRGNQVGLIHASPAGQVTIAKNLQQYVSRIPQAIGIVVVRPVV